MRRVAGVDFRPLPRRALRPLPSSSAVPSPIFTPSAAMEGPSHSEYVRTKFLEMQARRGRVSAAPRPATEVANVRNDSEFQDLLALGARADSSLSQTSTRAGSGLTTPVASSERGCLQSMPTSKSDSQRTLSRSGARHNRQFVINKTQICKSCVPNFPKHSPHEYEVHQAKSKLYCCVLTCQIKQSVEQSELEHCNR